VVDEDLRLEGLRHLLRQSARHWGACIGDRANRRRVEIVESRVVYEVVEERRREVQRADALPLDEREGRSGVPLRLHDDAATDERHRDQRVDAHRVVEGHHPQRAVFERESVLDDLRETGCPLRAV
jgi:hypothetical protein